MRDVGDGLVKIRAERRAGELLAGLDRNPVGRPIKKYPHDGDILSPYETAKKGAGLADTTADRWQEEATVPEPQFAKEAKERQREHGGTAPGTRKNTSGKSATSERARDAAGKALGRGIIRSKRADAGKGPDADPDRTT